MQSFVDKGAIAFAGTLRDEKFLTEAFAGTDGVFFMIPPDNQYEGNNWLSYQYDFGFIGRKAMEKAGVKRVVFLSAAGAELKGPTGHLKILRETEKELDSLTDVQKTYLRPGVFMENILDSLPLVKTEGYIGTPFGSNVVLPYVAAKDIAKEAVNQLTNPNSVEKQIKYLLGPNDWTWKEITQVLRKLFDLPELPYIQFPLNDVKQAMLSGGHSEGAANAYIEFFDSANNGYLSDHVFRKPEDWTETKLNDFLKQQL